MGEQGPRGALPAGQALAVYEEMVERESHGAEKVAHVLKEPGVRDTAVGKRGRGAAQHGDAGEEALLLDDQAA
jgi:hypothetical protein